MTTAARQIAEKVKAAFEALDAAAMTACYADDAVMHHPIFGDLTGNQAIGGFDTSMAAIVSDIDFDIEDVIEHGDTAAVLVRFAGTHVGPFPKPDGTVVEPSGERIEDRIVQVIRLGTDGRIAEATRYMGPGWIMQVLLGQI